MTIESYDFMVISGTRQEAILMPKDTFHHLPKDKASRIEEAAIEEFMTYSFSAASINRIVDKAGIAKGSFYQYFTNKKDLYKHILNQIAEQKMAYLSPVMANPLSVDFFTLLREVYISALRFARSHPRLQRIGNQLLSDRSNPVYQEYIQENMYRADQTFQLLIDKGIERGDIREDIDRPMVAWLISRLNLLLADYYQENVQLELDESYMAAVDKFIDLICHGISRQEA